MKKIYKITLLFLIIVCTSLGLIGCKVKGHVIGLSDYYYDDSENYTAGEAELTETVENIEIDWMVGNVLIQPHNLNTVSLSEESEKELTENKMLHYWLENTTLRIKFCGCGKQDFSDMDKKITILVPDTLILSNLKVSTLSADIHLSDCAVSQLVKTNTLSGKLEANFIQPLNEFEGSSTSGSFLVSARSISSFKAESVSGVVDLSVEKEPVGLDIDTTSGNIKLNLPESASFTLNYDTTSGIINSDLDYNRSKGKYIFGDGKGEYKIVTVSGDIRIISNK